MFAASDRLFPGFGPDDDVGRHGPQYEAVIDYVREIGLRAELEGRIRRPALDPETIPTRNWPNSPDDL